MSNHWYETIDDSMSPEYVRLMLEGAGLEIFRVSGPRSSGDEYAATVRMQDAHYDGRAIRSGSGFGATENQAIRSAVEGFLRAADIVIR